ncbi:MAG: PfaD family polyunsaturated fatty acid/polyketide biosynthesis protein [Myxococcaceae bacterium]|nr:PfaD family polyunsaturated fatty acid/polyketide biosynthesis protein [Myxococcaceae bacterium]
MTRSPLAAHSLGAFTPGAFTPRTGPGAFRELLAQVGSAVSVVDVGGRPAIATGGSAVMGVVAQEGQLALLGHAPSLTPDRLGDRTFTAAYGLRAPYVVGEMANGIASEALVEASARAGLLGIFGAAGLTVPRVTQALDRLQVLEGLPWGINLIHSPDDQALEAALVELFLARRVRVVSASAYLDLTQPLVKWRLAGIHRDATGAIVTNRLIAKVSRVEVARKFLEPAPERFVSALVASGALTAEQATLAAQVPMADDVTCEADSGGHTDNRPLVLLLPAIQALRDEICQQRGYLRRPRIGAAGGLATPASVASAFAMGAAYVVTGSINQATREAGTSDLVRQLLAQASSTDVAMAPAADMFEMGVKVQVLTRGTLFAVRAQRLYELYRTHESIAALPPAIRAELESKYFRTTLEAAWEGCERFFRERDPAQLEKAAKEPKHQLALLFRAYLGQASKWANEGVGDRALDFQVWCGPAMGGFNAWAKGSVLERWDARDVVTIAQNLLVGACVLTRVAALRAQGVVLPAEVEAFAPRTRAELDALVQVETAAAPVVAATTPSADVTGPRRKEPIAIVGIGALFPKAENLSSLWRLLRTGQDAVGDVPATHFALADYFDADQKAPDMTYARRGAFLSATPFDPTEFGIPPAILEATDTSQLLSLVVAKMALEDAGYPEDGGWDRSRTSVLLGVTGTQELVISLGARLGHPHWKKALSDAGVDEATAKDVVERIGASYVGWQENSFPGLLGNVVAGRIANRFDLGGTNCVVDAACASSLGALHLGLAELESGRADMVLTGGVDTLNDIFMHMCFSKTPALSPTGDARPFSDRADGTLLGEGVGMVVLKRLSDAERDGDRVYALIRGLGTSSDGRAKSIYAPLSKGQARALKAAYRDANVRPRDIGLLEAHGTGTKAGDAAEFEGLVSVFREDSSDAPWCALGSVKSQVGHTKAAAGAAGLIKAALALHHKVLPPTIKIDRPNPALKIDESPFSLPTSARPWLRSARGPRLAAVSSFGFGGSNFHTVLEEYADQRAEPAWDGSVEIVALSAPDAAALSAKVQQAMQARDVAAFAAESRANFKPDAALRLLAVVEAGRSLASVFEPVLQKVTAGQAFSTPDGVMLGVGPVRGGLAFLFPGQGSQHVDMLRDVATVFPEVLASVDAMPEVAAQIYPLPTFDPERQREREAALTKTNVAQPAIGLVSRGLLRVLARFGVSPALVAGHSYGELVALHAAGVLSAHAFEEASRTRGALMAGDGSDLGTMLAVLAPLSDVERLLADEKLELVLANRNGPAQGVLSGARVEIDRAEAACKARGLRATRLNVGAAFHSPLVAGAAKAFAEALAKCSFERATVPVIANTTAEAYPSEAASARAMLAQQLAHPVRFDAVVERLYALGARTFVEVGPRSALTGMVKAILGERAFTAVAVDAQTKRGGVFEVAVVLARLAAEGHPVRLSEWQRPARPPRWVNRPPRVPKMTVPLTGANYRSPVTPKPRVMKRAPAVAQQANGVHVNGKNGTNGVHPVQAPVVQAPASSPDALRVYQENLRALQALQEQTARVHQLFLEGQLAAQQNVAALLTGQAMPALPIPPMSVPALPAPAPTLPVQTVAQPVSAPVAPAPMNGSSAPVTTALAAPALKKDPAPVTADVVPLLLQVVSEATGYPVETLALGMDLEADLGIDSIKRVEILSMLSRRVPGAPSVNPEKLGSLRTLQQVADFVKGSSATVAPGPAPVAAPAVDAKTTLLTTVGELTGYPVETLSLEMDLEADLGIDSIKRVEILSLLSRRIPGAPSVNPEKLSGLKTLKHVLEFIGSVAPAPVAAAAPGPGADTSGVLLSTVAELTGYPVETLSLSMDLEADLGIDSIKRVEILSLLSRRIPNAPSVDPEKLSGLRTLEQVLAFVAGSGAVVKPAEPAAAPVPPSVAHPEVLLIERASSSATAATVQRRVVVPVRARVSTSAVKWPAAPIVVTDHDPALAAALVKALSRAGQAAQLVSAGGALPQAVGGAVLTAPSGSAWNETVEGQLGWALQLMRELSPVLRATPGAFVAAVSRRDGAFGFGGGTTAHPLAGAMNGLVKTLALEWPEVRCQSLDVSPLWALEDAAAVLVDELASDGPSELGLGPAGRVTLALRESSVSGGRVPLQPKDVVVVTGGARGVTADCAKALAEASGATLVLLGRTAAPTTEPEWLASARDEAAVKRVLLERAPAGNRPSPRQLAESSRAVLAARDIRTTLESMAQRGVTAEYRQVDVRDAESVSTVLREVRESVGPIRGVVHGAGVLRDKRIEDKRDDDFQQVLDPKIGGLRAVLDATRSDELAVLALFSSVSGRFGRRGQSDYALANQALVSVAQAEALRRPSCRVVALDWGPWAGGMVTPALEATFRAEGISLIPLAAGARAFVEELSVDALGPREVVLSAGFGDAAEAGWSLVAAERVERSWPVLADHRLNGKPVLPFAVSLEWFTRAARALSDGRAGIELDDVRVLRGVTFDDEREELSIWSGRPERRGEAVAIPLELRNRKDVVHVRGVAVLRDVPAPVDGGVAPQKVGPFVTAVSELYASQLFHGPSLWAIRSIEALGEDGMQLTLKAHPSSERLVPGPSRPWAIDPLVVDGLFQALIVWSRARLGAPCLPSKVGALKCLAAPTPGDVKATIRVRSAEGSTVIADVELFDAAQVRFAVLEGAEATVSSTLNRAFAADAAIVQPTPQA